jgi:MFS family permease
MVSNAVKLRIPKLSAAPFDVLGQQRKNYVYVQIDAIAIGLTSAAGPFLPVFLARLGATSTQVGLLTSMPGITGLILAVFIGQFLQGRRNVVPWFSLSRLLVVSAYAATGLAPYIVPEQYVVITILAIWALATIPQTSLSVTFSVVMNAVAGPNLRYDLMSRRWSILGITNALSVAIAGQVLEWLGFPFNYQVVFLALSLGGLLSYYYSSRIALPDVEPPPSLPGRSLTGRVADYYQLVIGNRPFMSFAGKRFVYQFGMLIATPLFPLYYVHTVKASDAAIGWINTFTTAALVLGYFIWPWQSRRRGATFVLLAVTLGQGFHPGLVSSTDTIGLIMVFGMLSGFFQAGIDLVFFDEMMKTVPIEYSATFVSLAQMLNYLPAILAPMFGTWLSDIIGLPAALMVSSSVRLLGFALFFLGGTTRLRRRPTLQPGRAPSGDD